MTKNEKEKFNQLCRNNLEDAGLISDLCNIEFLEFLRQNRRDEQIVKSLLFEAIESRDAEEVEMTLDTIICLGIEESDCDLLSNLFMQNWHFSHENMIDILEDFPDNEFVGQALLWASVVNLDYLSYNDSMELARKSMYAISKMSKYNSQKELDDFMKNLRGERLLIMKGIVENI